MPFPPRREHKITLAEAKAMTKKHRDDSPGGGVERAHMFPRDVFEALLANPKVRGVRLYHGKGTGGENSLVVVGVDADGNDLLDGDIIDRGFPCPPFCTGAGGLND
jgi:hypothetical protein